MTVFKSLQQYLKLSFPLFIFFATVLAFPVDLKGQDLTTIILVRHAEKTSDGTNDPVLSKEGKSRAQRLATMFSKTTFSAIYSTPYQRTEQTAAPLAQLNDLEITIYDPTDPNFIATLLKKERGGTILLTGHSNTTPRYANQLLGEDKFEQFEESDYENIIIITTKEKSTTLVHLRY